MSFIIQLLVGLTVVAEGSHKSTLTTTIRDGPEMPLGIAILAVLKMIGGLISFFFALIFFRTRKVLADLDVSELSRFARYLQTEDPRTLSDMLISIATTLMLVAICLGIFLFIVSWGFLKSKGWARLLGIAFNLLFILIGILGIISNFFTLFIGIGFMGLSIIAINIIFAHVVIIPNLLILFYLFTPRAKAWFDINMQKAFVGQPFKRTETQEGMPVQGIEGLYERVLEAYVSTIGGGRQRFEMEIRKMEERGLTREQAIQKIAKKLKIW